MAMLNNQRVIPVAYNPYLILRTDPVVYPDCNIEDSLSSNVRREIAENTAYTQRFLLSDSEFSGF